MGTEAERGTFIITLVAFIDDDDTLSDSADLHLSTTAEALYPWPALYLRVQRDLLVSRNRHQDDK